MPSINSPSLYQRIKLGLIRVHHKSPANYRFWKYVDKDGPIHPIYGQCWEWIGHKFHNGYGQFKNGGTTPIRAHRYSWMKFRGVIPKGLLVLHHCDNPACVNPKHLFLGTHNSNMDDMVSKDRAATGDRNGTHLYPEKVTRGEDLHSAVLTEEIVIELRKIPKRFLNFSRLGRKYGVCSSTIKKATSGRSWKHV